MIRGLSVAAMLLLGAATGSATLCNSGGGTAPRHEVRLLFGYSPDSPTLIGTATDRRFALAEIGYSYRCWAWGATSLSYNVAAAPAAILIQPAPGRHAVYGFAVTPIGFFAEFARRRRVHPVAELNGGVIVSTQPIPIVAPDATGLNFLFDIGAGLRWSGRRSAITVGYRFLHISNAYTTAFNPGVDNGVFYVSYSFLR